MMFVRVNGKDYDGFTSITMKDSIDQLCNQFTLKCSADSKAAFPIPRGSAIEIFIDEFKIFTGVVEGNSGGYSATSYQVILTGRDDTRDVLKADLKPNFVVKGPIQLKKIMEKTLAKANIDLTVIDTVGDLDNYTKKEVLTDDVGSTIWDFWVKLKEKRQVLITKDEDSNILIRNPNDTKYKTSLVQLLEDPSGNNNIVSANWNFDDSERRHEYNVYSQVNHSVQREEEPPAEGEIWEPTPEDPVPTDPQNQELIDELTREIAAAVPGSEVQRVYQEQLNLLTGGEPEPQFITTRVQTRGTVTDDAINIGSVMHETAENPSDNDECLRLAKWKCNLKRIEAENYTAVLSDFLIDGAPIRAGVLIDVVDEIASINSTMLIKSVTFTTSVSEKGETTETATLTFTIPDGYSQDATASTSQKQTGVIGGNWNEGNFQ